MNPRRVTEEFPRSLEAQLLRSGRDLTPPPEQLGRTLVAISLLGANNAKAAGLALTIKWATAGLVSGVALVVAASGARVAWSHFEGRSRVDMTRASRVVETSPPMMPSAVSKPTPELRIGSEPARATGVPLSNVQPSESAHALPVHQPPNIPSASLGQEVAQIDRVRSELVQHRPARALALLDDFARQFPSPRLAEEATYLRVLALEGAGRRLEAERASVRFRQRFPSSPLLAPETQKDAPEEAQ